MKLIQLILIFIVSELINSVSASELNIPNTFQASTPARAAEVNENFNAVKSSVDDNDARIAALEVALVNLQTAFEESQQTLGSLQTDLVDAQNTIADLQSEIETLQDNSVLALNDILTLTTDAYGRTNALFSGVNLQVVNGTGAHDELNSHGNLIIGYDEGRGDSGTAVCASFNYDNETDCVTNGYIWAVDHKSGSHSLIVGRYHNYSHHSGLLGGRYNGVYNAYTSVSGGGHNNASGFGTSVSGGNGNDALEWYSSISGGTDNTTTGRYASISGGENNTSTGEVSSVSGGSGNDATGNVSSVSGGFNRSATDNFDWAAGSLSEDN